MQFADEILGARGALAPDRRTRASGSHPDAARSIADRAVEWYSAFRDLWNHQYGEELGELRERPRTRDQLPTPIVDMVPLLDADDDEDTLPGSKAVARYRASELTPAERPRLLSEPPSEPGIRLVGYPAPKPPPAAPEAPPETAYTDSASYARLRLRHDYLAKLWVYGLTPRDVVVWSPTDRCWAPMLSIRPLRSAVLDLLEACEGHPESLTSIRQSASELGIDSLLPMPAPRTEPPPVAGQGTSSSIPPAVLSARPPEIPRAPKVPFFGDAPGRLGLSSLLGGLSARGSIGRVERLAWTAAAVALIVATALVSRGRGRVGLPPPSAALANSAARVPACVEARAEPKPAPAPTERIFSISDLPLESEATPSAPAPTQSVLAALSPSRKRRALAKPAGGGTEFASSPAPESSPAKSVPSVESPPTTRGLDAEAARRALDGAARRARLCGDKGARGTVVVTFNVKGIVQSATVASAVGAQVDCLQRTFSQVRVPPFAGPPVTVKKSFSTD
jgi:hypothetical protein